MQNLFAQEQAVQSPPPNIFMSFVPLMVIFAIFYFLLFRPQQKRQKEHQKMLDTLRKGDYVLTGGGIYGTIVNIKGSIVELKIADDVKIQVAKSSIVQLIQQEAS